MRKARFYYLLRRGLLTGAASFITEGLVMASKFITQGLTFPAQGSAEFNGTSDYIEVDTSIDETFGAAAFWFYSDSVTNSSTSANYIVDLDIDLGEQAIVLGTWTGSYANEVISLGAQTPSPWRIAWDTSDANAIAAGWNHVAITQTSGTYSIYLNGSSVPVTDYGTPPEFTINKIAIGARKLGASIISYFNGNLANVAIWNRALSSDEINSVMWKPVQALSATESNGLQAWYSLDDIASPTASLASMEQLATDKDATIENKAAITAAVNSLS
jgi:hypothetical protein